MELGTNEVGELWVQHPIVMQGYFRDPEQTRAAFRDGWFMTGDLVKRDADGFYHFVTRKKDIIRRRGENIAGAEIDRIIQEHPGVFEVAAVPVPSVTTFCRIPSAVAMIDGETAGWGTGWSRQITLPRLSVIRLAGTGCTWYPAFISVPYPDAISSVFTSLVPSTAE